MASRSLYKSFTARPLLAVNLDHEQQDLREVLRLLEMDVRTLTDLAEYHLRSDETLLKDLDAYLSGGGTGTPQKIMERLKVRLPAEFRTRRTGASRFESLFQDRVGREALSWLERSKAVDGSTDKYVSRGWTRTADSNRPSNLSPKVSLSTVDKQYARIEMIDDNSRFLLWVVVGGQWYGILFRFDTDRFAGSTKLCLPDIVVGRDGALWFHFAVEYAYEFHAISEEFVVGVDVGVNDTLHAVVVRVSDGGGLSSTLDLVQEHMGYPAASAQVFVSRSHYVDMGRALRQDFTVRRCLVSSAS